MSETEAKKVQEKFLRHAKEHNLCESYRTFTLGAHGTVYVGCGLPPKHESHIDGEPGITYPKHQAVQTDEDGAQVIFTWVT